MDDAWTRMVDAMRAEEEAPVPEKVSGAFVAVLLDLGCIRCGAAPQVRGVWTDAGTGRMAFLHETRRLEIMPGDVVGVGATSWERFLRAGGSEVLMCAGYHHPDPADGDCGDRALVLVASRLL